LIKNRCLVGPNEIMRPEVTVKIAFNKSVLASNFTFE